MSRGTDTLLPLPVALEELAFAYASEKKSFLFHPHVDFLFVPAWRILIA